MSTVLSGICVGGPKHGQSLATLTGRRVPHPQDQTGAYFHKPASGVESARWLWVVEKKEDSK